MTACLEITLLIIGGILLFAGLALALTASRYEAAVMGETRLGMSVLGSKEDTPEYRAKRRLRILADVWFFSGLGVTALGVACQTIGGVLALLR